MTDDREHLLGGVVSTVAEMTAAAVVSAAVNAFIAPAPIGAWAVCVFCTGVAGAFGFYAGRRSGQGGESAPSAREPSLDELCRPLSERCRAMLLEALDTGEVVAYYETDSDACYLVDKGLLEAPSVYSPVIPVKLHIAPGRYEELSRRREELLGDIPEKRRRKLIG